MRADIPKADQNLNDTKQHNRLKPFFPICRLIDQLTSSILYTAILKLIEVANIAKRQIILQNP